MSVDAVVLAGGSCDHLQASAPYKGVLTIAGRPMIDYVLDALEGSDGVRGVAVVVPSAVGLGTWADRADKIVLHDEGVVANLLAGVDSFGYERHILALAADIPLITSCAVTDFLARCGDFGHDVYYPVLERRVAEAAYPGVQRTYMRLTEGTYTGGNLILMDPRKMRQNAALAEQIFAARKSPFGMVRILGLSFVLRLFARRLSIPDLEAKVGELIDGRAKAVDVPYAEIALDVDKPSDLAIARGLLEHTRAEAGRRGVPSERL